MILSYSSAWSLRSSEPLFSSFCDLSVVWKLSRRERLLLLSYIFVYCPPERGSFCHGSGVAGDRLDMWPSARYTARRHVTRTEE